MTAPDRIAPEELIGTTLPAGTREVRAVTATTIFGAFGRGGTSGPFGNDTDSALLLALRNWADVILVGAETVRKEEYSKADTPYAIISRSLELDPSLGVFEGTVHVLAPERSLHGDSLQPARDALHRAGAQLVSTGGGTAKEILEALRQLGYPRVSCEGGPGLYADMLAADLVDVLHLTVDPTLGHNDTPYGLDIDEEAGPFTYRFVLEDARATADSLLFCRYRRVRGS